MLYSNAMLVKWVKAVHSMAMVQLMLGHLMAARGAALLPCYVSKPCHNSVTGSTSFSPVRRRVCCRTLPETSVLCLREADQVPVLRAVSFANNNIHHLRTAGAQPTLIWDQDRCL